MKDTTPARRRPRTELFQQVFEKGPHAVVIVDERRRYVDGNRAARSFFGVSRDELLKRRIEDFTPREGLPYLERAWAILLAQGYVEGPYPVVVDSGLQRNVFFQARANAVPGRH